MTEIPQQLRREGYRFTLLRGKIPFLKDWQNTNNFPYDHDKIQVHDGNIGVVCGYNELLVIDIDKNADETLKLLFEKLPKSYTVKTGKQGYHLYYKVNDPENLKSTCLDIGESHLDIQFTGKQVVIAGSIHPETKQQYKEYYNVPVVHIDSKLLRPFFKKDDATEKTDTKRTTIDKSRSAMEYQEVCRLVARGLTKQTIFKRMQAFVKWNEGTEAYREKTYEKATAFITENKNKKPVFETTTANKEVLDILENPNIYDLIDKELDKKIVQEHESRRNVFFTANLTHVENHNPTSSNLMVNSLSGTGKDHIVKNTLGIFPTVRVIKRTKISPATFTYWKPVEDWNGFICYLEDISNNILNHDVFKVMASGGSYATVVIKQVAVDIEIKGKPSIIITMAAANPKYENLRRFPICDLDDSVDQTKQIMRMKLKNAKEGITEKYNPLIIQALACLKRIKVKIPFADDFFDILPQDHIIMRTNTERFLDLIKSSTALHQYQREQDEDGYYLATPQDYEYARKIINHTTSNQYSIPLTKDQKRIIESLRSMGDGYHLFNPDILNKITFMSERWLQKNLDRLTEHGLIQKEYEKVENSNRPKLKYRLLNFTKIELPEYVKVSCRNRTNKTNKTNKTYKTIKTNKVISPICPIRPPVLNIRKQHNSNILTSKPEKTMDELLDYVRIYDRENNGDLIFDEAGFSEKVVKKALQDGLIFTPKPNTYKVVE